MITKLLKYGRMNQIVVVARKGKGIMIVSEVFEWKQQAESWMREAADYIRWQMHQQLDIKTKEHRNDLVTHVDEGVESFFIERLKSVYPDHRIMGEEGSFKQINDLDGVVWILDPIDGTMNFVHQKKFFAVSLGIYVDGKPAAGLVFDVMADEMYTAVSGYGAYLNGKQLPQLTYTPLEDIVMSVNNGWIAKDDHLKQLVTKVRGSRSYGVASLEMAFVASGSLDAYVSFNLAPWDVAAGIILLQETGGLTSNLRGEPLSLLKKDSLIAASPSVHEELIKWKIGH